MSERQIQPVRGVPLEYRHVPSPPGAPTLVFLHEALGSLEQWRDFPERLAAATGLGWMAYSRQGHGRSGPFGRPRDFDYLDHEAMDMLPAMLRAAGIERPILFGHSDGATIALIYAASSSDPLAGLVIEAPHVMVEEATGLGVRAAVERARDGELVQRLGKYHDRPEILFEAWHKIWLDPGFEHWTIEHRLPAIVTPILQIQGTLDQYATLSHLESIAQLSGGPVDTLVLDDIGHVPHQEAPDRVIEESAAFVRKLGRA
ncbi:MAG TPA: alpha/beta hydrolase [Aliidongia sp.]|nr:alpha/beta hydrolase [Aliidongia sp.]